LLTTNHPIIKFTIFQTDCLPRQRIRPHPERHNFAHDAGAERFAPPFLVRRSNNTAFPLSTHSYEADNSTYSALLYRTIQKVSVSLKEQGGIKIYGEENE
jgi:hypothetical protein